MSEQNKKNKIDEIKARMALSAHGPFLSHAFEDMQYLLQEIERKDEALRTMAESPDEWYVGRTPMREYARQALEAL